MPSPGHRLGQYFWVRTYPCGFGAKGIASGAQVEFLSPATNAPIPTITAYSPPEVVENSTSHPGYSGIRNFLMVDPSTPEGPVNVRITNPNGSSQVANQLFSIVTSTDGANGPSGMTNNSVVGECPPQDIPLQSITSVKPTAVNQGETFELEITGIGFACGAVVAIEPGGFVELSPPLLLPGQPGTPPFLRYVIKPTIPLPLDHVQSLSLIQTMSQKLSLTLLRSTGLPAWWRDQVVDTFRSSPSPILIGSLFV